MVGYVKGAVGVALVVSSAFSSLIASADVNPAPLDPAKVEGCVDLLRAAPAIFEGSSKFSSYDFSVIWLAGKDTSQAFTNCIKSTGAESEGEGHYDYLVMVEYDSALGARIDFDPDDSLVYDDFPLSISRIRKGCAIFTAIVIRESISWILLKSGVIS
jgi:hypothetical protein